MPPISFNGKEYASPDAMPPDVRQLYDMAMGLLADKDGDGVPDLLQGAAGQLKATSFSTSQYVVDGTAYGSLEEIPPEARQRVQAAMGRLDADGDGVPDLLQGAGVAGAAAQPRPQGPAAPGSTMPHVTVVGEGRGGAPLWIGAIALIVLLAGAVLFLLLTR